MCYVEQIFRAARKSGTHAFIVEAGSAPRWVSQSRLFEPRDEVQSDVLTAFLFRVMPASSQARLAMGQPVEFCAQVQGDEWALRAESTDNGFFVQATPIQSVEESMSHCPVEIDVEDSMEDTRKFCEVEPHEEESSTLPPPPRVKSSQTRGGSLSNDDDFDQIQFQHQPKNSFGIADTQSPGANDPGPGRSKNKGAGVPAHVEDHPFGMSSGAISLGYPEAVFHGEASRNDFDPVGSLILAKSTAIVEACVEHLQEPVITVRNESSLFDSYTQIDSLKAGSCVSVMVEDPSIWFSWIMRRLEQGCSVVVLCRAQDELGALRVLCGLNPELPTARWLAEHRRVFVGDAQAVNALFLAELDQVAG